MGGILKAIGCLTVLLVIAAVGYFSRGKWMRYIPGLPRDTVLVVASAPTWQPLTPTGAQRARGALERLRSPRGPAFVTVNPGDLAAYIFQELSRTLPSSADSIEAAVIGDRLYVRAVVKVADLVEKGSMGPLSLLLGDRERVLIGGTLRILRPGFAELAVKEFKIRDLNVPQALIPRIVREMSRGERPPELAPDGIPLRTPEFIGDVRVEDGRVTMYKSGLTARSGGRLRLREARVA